MANTTGITIVEDSAETARAAGAVTYWRLRGEAPCGPVATALATLGISPPDLPSHADALSRAVHAVTEQRLMARTLSKGGYQLVREIAQSDGETLTWTPVLTVKLDALQRVQCKVLHAEGESLVSVVHAHYTRALDHYTPGDFGSWLVRQAESYRAVSLRQHGGVYFVPRDTLTAWRGLYEAIHNTTSHTVYEIPAMPSQSVVRAVLDAVVEEAETQAAQMAADLSNPELGDAARRNRTARAEEAMERIDRWTTILGSGLEAVREKMEHLRGGVGVSLARDLTGFSEDAA